jgi:predicted DNA-binding transcriptional regulator AlpA
MAKMSVRSTGLSRDERSGGRNGGAPQQPDYVRSIRETAEILGIGVPSLRVLIRDGKGPQVTRLSARRIGIRDSHREAWLDSRAQAHDIAASV